MRVTYSIQISEFSHAGLNKLIMRVGLLNKTIEQLDFRNGKSFKEVKLNSVSIGKFIPLRSDRIIKEGLEAPCWSSQVRIMTAIGAHWYLMPATLRECTEQSLFFLEKLKEHNSLLFGVWFEKGGSRKHAVTHPVEFTYDYIRKLFTRRGKDDAYPDISYSLGIWNGAVKDEETASLSVSLGSTESLYFTNNCFRPSISRHLGRVL